MQINERIVGEVAIVKVIGDIVANSGDPLLKDKVSSLRQQGYTRVVVDLGKVRYMDSAGLGDLIFAYATTQKSGGTLKPASWRTGSAPSMERTSPPPRGRRTDGRPRCGPRSWAA